MGFRTGRAQAEALFKSRPEPKRLHDVKSAGHLFIWKLEEAEAALPQSLEEMEKR